MVDFLMISTRQTKRGTTEIYPKFIIRNPSQHLMIRGGDFYAIWVEEKGLWSTSEQDAVDIIDGELDKYAKENASRFENGYKVLHLWDAESGMIDVWHKYCQWQMRDSFHMLDEKLIFQNTPTNRQDYASKRLPYPLEDGDVSAWNRLVSVLYSPAERKKIEWAIGSIVSGDSLQTAKVYGFLRCGGNRQVHHYWHHRAAICGLYGFVCIEGSRAKQQCFRAGALQEESSSSHRARWRFEPN